jgi:hypothetical protein
MPCHIFIWRNPCSAGFSIQFHLNSGSDGLRISAAGAAYQQLQDNEKKLVRPVNWLDSGRTAFLGRTRGSLF